MKHLLCGSAASLLIGTPALAGSFAINENSANDLGRANSGRVVSTDDALPAFGNPALMPEFDTLTLSNHLSFISGDARLLDRGSVDVQGNPLGGDTDDIFTDAFVPALQAIYPVTDDLALGLSVNAPFGLASEYEPDSVARYQAIESELTTININPSVGYRLSDRLSVGGGVSLQYAKAKLTNAINLNTVALAAVSCIRAPCNTDGRDGFAEIEGTDWSWGWNVGVALRPTERITLGATYRSEVDHTLQGEAEFDLPDNPIITGIVAQTGLFQDTDGQAALELPGTLEAGAKLDATDRLSLFADVTVQYWSDLTELRVEFDNPAQADTVEELDYETSARYSVGADYDVSSRWTLRAGYAYDESPSQPGLSTARIPDNDRSFFAVGATFRGWHFAQIDVGYNYVDVDPTDFDRTNALGDRVRGEVRADVHIMSVGVTKRF